MNDLIVITVSYLVVFLMAAGFIGFFQGGMFIPWLKVKTSRERKVLVKIRGQIKDRFSVGNIVEGFLVYPDGKSKKRLNAPPGITYKAIGVQCVDVDDEHNAICKPDYSVVSGYDAVKNENLHVRALTAPQIDDKTLKIILVCIIIALGLCALTAFLVYNVSVQVENLGRAATAVVK